MDTRQNNKLNRYLFLAFIILFAVFLLHSLAEFFTSFLGAVMFYVLSKPMMGYLMKKLRWRKSYAAILVIVVSFFIILLPLLLVGSMLYRQAIMIATDPQTIIQPLKELDATLNQKLHIKLLSGDTYNNVQKYATIAVSLILNTSLNFFSSIAMMYFLLYFLLISINRLEAAIIFYLPFKRNMIEIFGNELVAQTISNAVGIPLIAVIHGLLAWAAYSITGLSQASFWAVLTGFASIIPVVGTMAVWVPAAIFMFATGHSWEGFFIVAWGAIIIGSSDNVIRFLLARKMADVHPIVTVLGVIIGLKMFGITGLIFGPLIISYFLILLKIYYVEYQRPELSERKNVRRLLPPYLNLPFLHNNPRTGKRK